MDWIKSDWPIKISLSSQTVSPKNDAYSNKPNVDSNEWNTGNNLKWFQFFAYTVHSTALQTMKENTHTHTEMETVARQTNESHYGTNWEWNDERNLYAYAKSAWAGTDLLSPSIRIRYAYVILDWPLKVKFRHSYSCFWRKCRLGIGARTDVNFHTLWTAGRMSWPWTFVTATLWSAILWILQVGHKVVEQQFCHQTLHQKIVLYTLRPV